MESFKPKITQEFITNSVAAIEIWPDNCVSYLNQDYEGSFKVPMTNSQLVEYGWPAVQLAVVNGLKDYSDTIKASDLFAKNQHFIQKNLFRLYYNKIKEQDFRKTLNIFSQYYLNLRFAHGRKFLIQFLQSLKTCH